MCRGDDQTCPDFELHRQKLLDDLDSERRSFLKSAFLAGGGAAAVWAGGGTLATPASAQTSPGQPTYHFLPANADTVHWGYFSKLLKPQIEVDSGDYITIEALTHHADDDAERMIKGDPGAESMFLWTKDKKGVNRRGAGPIDGKLLGRGVRRRLRRAYLHGAGLYPRRRAGRHRRSPYHGRETATVCQSGLRGEIVRQQRGSVVGLPLQRSTYRAEAARSLHDLRNRYQRPTQLGASGLQFPLDAADRSVRRRTQDHRLSRRSSRPFDRPGKSQHPQERSHTDPTALRRYGLWRQRKPISSNSIPPELFRRQHGQLAYRQGRYDVLSGCRAGRAVFNRRFPCRTRRFRTVWHRDRNVADRNLPAHSA